MSANGVQLKSDHFSNVDRSVDGQRSKFSRNNVTDCELEFKVVHKGTGRQGVVGRELVRLRVFGLGRLDLHVLYQALHRNLIE